MTLEIEALGCNRPAISELAIERSYLDRIESLSGIATRSEMALRSAKVQLGLIQNGMAPDACSIARTIAEIDRALVTREVVHG